MSMDIASLNYWQAVVQAANSEPALYGKAAHLEALTITFQIGETLRIVELHRGRAELLAAVPLRGTTLRISGPLEEWRSLVSGAIPLAKAINTVHGQLRMQGDVIAGAWATPALWELFRVSARVYGEGVNHG
jgi:hypothetical protein